MKTNTLDQITANRNSAIKTICDPSIKLYSLSYAQRQELTRNYLDCISGTGFMGKYLYGVNVRTSDDLDNIYPYFASSSSDFILERPEDDKTLPKFADRFGIRELYFYADFNASSEPTKIEILTLIFDAEIDQTSSKEEIEKWLLLDDKNFFRLNVKNLGIRSERVYMWLSSEDFFTGPQTEMQDYWAPEDNPFGKKNGQALSNILAISNDRDFLQNHIISRRIDLLNFLILLKARNLFEQNLKRLRASEKSAKAAIMSRNMSHNLGSHVMAYLKQHLYSVQDMIKDNILDQILSPEDTLETIQNDVDGWLEKVNKKIKDNGDNIQEIAMPFLVGLGKFISYLQERQDFIATIATDYNPYFSTVNFKDFVYDELNPDLRYERHKDRSGMRPDNILLGNIAKSEGLARVTRPTQSKKASMSDIVLKFRHFDGNPVFDIDGKTILPGREKALKSLDQMRNVEISLPGGVVGRQAFFSIVENLIRNAAKHGKWGEEAGSSKKDLVITFDFYKDVKDFSHASISDQLVSYERSKTKICRPVYGELDSRDFLKKYYSCANDISDLYVFTATDNMWFELVPTENCFIRYKNNPAVLEKLFQLASKTNLKGMRAALRQRYIDKQGKMINENKGIKEMRISAAWMRSLEDSLNYNPFLKEGKTSIDEHESPSFDEKHRWIGKAPILLARAVAQLDQNKKKVVIKTSIKIDNVDYEIEATPYNLQLLFCLMKPKKVAIISDRRIFSETFRQQLREMSWAAYSSSEYRDRKNINRSYEFVIVDDIEENSNLEVSSSNIFQRIRCISHSRTYKLSSLPKDLQKRLLNVINNEKHDRITLDGIEMALYKKLADFSKTDSIRVNDQKTFAKYQDKNGLQHSPIVSIVNGDNRDNQGKLCRYIYRKHHETDIEFKGFMSELPVIDLFASNSETLNPNVVSFVEGITGNNSTDRLVRNELLTDKWAYAHLHAMKQKIAIFDERIFSKVYRKDEMDIVNHKKKTVPYIPLSEEKITDIIEQYADILPNDVINATTNEDLYLHLNSFLEKRHYKNQECIQADKMGLANAMKGVYVFNLIKAPNRLDIYGFVDQDSDGDKYYSLIGKLGSIIVDSNDKVIISLNKSGESYTGKFDRISIHQGLLDKVYETFGFKGKPSKKEEITNALYEKLSADKGAGTQFFFDDYNQENGTFLPHLMIHSGRSKPSYTDMPQHQPFIQYAAIEHAVLDCKYSLVELMDYARFEQYED